MLYNATIKFELPHPPTSEEAIQIYEKQLRYMLPEEYRRFLLKYNGGENPLKFRFDYVRPNGSQNTLLLHDLNGLGVDKYRELNDRQQFHEDYPDYLLDIGSGANIMIGLGQTSDTFGKIYGWEHNASGDVILLADSFNKFLDMLYFEDL